MSVNNKNWQELKKPNTLEIKEGASSLNVFHSAQSGHWPCQRWWTLPQA